MKKIVSKLVECGFSFEYENRNSSGEKVTVWDNMLSIHTYQGKLFFEHDGDNKELTENDVNYDFLCAKIEQIMIDETSSFN